MSEKLGNMGQIARKFVEQQIDAALTRNGLSYMCPVRAELECDVELVGDRNPVVRICDNNGRYQTLDSRIDQLRGDSRFASYFPNSSKVRIQRDNQREIQQSFDAIVRGDAIVE